jgi:hypothetical protein
MKEVWKDIPMYEGIYEVSSTGKVRSKVTGKLTTTQVNKKGYEIARIYLNGLCKNERVHRLVAFAFLPNPNDYPQINHKDENKLNNCVDNLEWCDADYNNHYGTHIIRSSMNQPKPVEVDGIEFSSITKCSKYLNVPHSTLNNYLRKPHTMPFDLKKRNLKFANK